MLIIKGNQNLLFMNIFVNDILGWALFNYLPLFSRAILSHKRVTSCILWDVRNMVVPFFCKFLISLRIFLAIVGSKPEVGSSKNNNFGEFIRALTNNIRWSIPTEILPVFMFFCLIKPTLLNKSSTFFYEIPKICAYIWRFSNIDNRS